tara:strand:- start:2557 stop:2754 length:198 start_codon:yes stop_codon:yes gene_type:complete
MDISKIESKIFNWDKLTKKELIHILVMHEKVNGKMDIFKTLNEVDFAGDGECKLCTKIYKKDLYK